MHNHCFLENMWNISPPRNYKPKDFTCPNCQPINKQGSMLVNGLFTRCPTWRNEKVSSHFKKPDLMIKL
jgi:hypothetical protein